MRGVDLEFVSGVISVEGGENAVLDEFADSVRVRKRTSR